MVSSNYLRIVLHTGNLNLLMKLGEQKIGFLEWLIPWLIESKSEGSRRMPSLLLKSNKGSWRDAQKIGKSYRRPVSVDAKPLPVTLKSDQKFGSICSTQSNINGAIRIKKRSQPGLSGERTDRMNYLLFVVQIWSETSVDWELSCLKYICRIH